MANRYTASSAATPADLDAVGGGFTTALDLATWTEHDALGGTSATIAAGIATLSVDATVNTAGAGPYVAGSHTADPPWSDVCARVDLTSGDGEATAAFATLWSGTSITNAVIAVLYADGDWKFGRLLAGAWTEYAAGTGATSSGQRTGGQLWLRLSWRGTLCRFLIGVGSAGALPTSWTQLAVAVPEAALLGQWIAVRTDTEPAAPATAIETEVLAVRAGVIL